MRDLFELPHKLSKNYLFAVYLYSTSWVPAVVGGIFFKKERVKENENQGKWKGEIIKQRKASFVLFRWLRLLRKVLYCIGKFHQAASMLLPCLLIKSPLFYVCFFLLFLSFYVNSSPAYWSNHDDDGDEEDGGPHFDASSLLPDQITPFFTRWW